MSLALWSWKMTRPLITHLGPVPEGRALAGLWMTRLASVHLTGTSVLPGGSPDGCYNDQPVGSRAVWVKVLVLQAGPVVMALVNA